jgi:hypothetical protein
MLSLQDVALFGNIANFCGNVAHRERIAPPWPNVMASCSDRMSEVILRPMCYDSMHTVCILRGVLKAGSNELGPCCDVLYVIIGGGDRSVESPTM